MTKIGGHLRVRNRVNDASPLSSSEAAWLAGFVDAEGSFFITPNNRGANWVCGLSVALRDDDAQLLVALQHATGLGIVRSRRARGSSKPQACWTISAKDEARAFAEILRRSPLRGRKRADAAIWCRAVEIWSSTARGLGRADFARMEQLALELPHVRKYAIAGTNAPPAPNSENLVDYFGGFFSGDGCLLLGDRSARAVIKIRRDDRPLLEHFASAFAIGLVRDHAPTPPSAPTTAWRVLAARDLPPFVALCDRAGFRGRKMRQYAAWRPAAIEIGSAVLQGRQPDIALLAAARENFAHASAYRSEIDAIPPRPTVEDSLHAYASVLREWAAMRGFRQLTCTAYDAERRPGWPNRETLRRVFGSWRAALGAADLL